MDVDEKLVGLLSLMRRYYTQNETFIIRPELYIFRKPATQGAELRRTTLAQPPEPDASADGHLSTLSGVAAERAYVMFVEAALYDRRAIAEKWFGGPSDILVVNYGCARGADPTSLRRIARMYARRCFLVARETDGGRRTLCRPPAAIQNPAKAALHLRQCALPVVFTPTHRLRSFAQDWTTDAHMGRLKVVCPPPVL